MIQVNKYQTEVTDELLTKLTKECSDTLLDYINTVPFIQWLISPDRPYAKDRPKDEKGRVVVDICKPHILEDMEYFRPAGNYYREHGVYTKLRPNTNPNSEFGRWFSTELDRIWNGYVRESDGEWVTGDMYFYLNYFPIIQTEITEGKKGGERIIDFPEVWEGTYLWFHYIDQARFGGLYNDWSGGQHAVQIARRGAGKSYTAAAKLVKLFTCGESSKVNKKVKSLITASEKEYLTKDGTLSKFVDGIDFCAEHTQFPSNRVKSSIGDMSWMMGYKEAESDIIKGTQNEVLGVSSKDNPDKARGKRSTLMIYEEFGMFPKFIDAWNVNINNVQEGDYAFGQAVAFGTGGSEGSDFSGALEMIYSPMGYNVYAIPNVFDRNSQGKLKTVFFFGSYLNRKGHYNKDGVSDVVGALITEIEGRINLKYNSQDPMSLTRKKAEQAITIQEAIMKRDGTIYPVADLNDRITQIDENTHHMDDMWVGDLKISKSNGIEYKPNLDKKAIVSFPHKDNKLEGAVCIRSMPVTDSSGRVPWGRYIAGIDPYDDDASNTKSLGALYILDMFTDELVFEYVGRPMFADDFYENCRRALMFYNAECNYENNKKGLFKYFSQHNALYLLSDTLDFLKDKDMMRGTLYGNKAHPYSQLVRTPDGIKNWGDITIGDLLFDTSGGVTKVIDIPFDAETDIYTITLRDNRKIQASLNHLWKVIDWNGYTKVLSTKQLINGFREKGKYKESKYYIPQNSGVDFKESSLPLDPYFLGLLLGDGCLTQSSKNQAYFTSTLIDMKFYMQILGYPYKTLDDRHHRIVYKNVKDKLIELQLAHTKSHTKFIPNVYKYNSRKVRLELIKGLMDTDGTVGYGGNPQYCTVSKQLSEDIMEVARSLGINCNLVISQNKFGKIYTIRFYTNIPLFKLERKLKKQKLTKTRDYKTAIIDISFSHKEKAKCVTVDSQDSCYLIGDFVTTHNSKGTISTEHIKKYARRCIRDWLLKPIQNTSIEVIDDKPVEFTTSIINLYRIHYRALLQELTQWNPDGNYDRHDALGMLMLLREDKLRLLGEISPSEAANAREINYLGDDDFFKKNWDDYISTQ